MWGPLPPAVALSPCKPACHFAAVGTSLPGTAVTHVTDRAQRQT